MMLPDHVDSSITYSGREEGSSFTLGKNIIYKTSDVLQPDAQCQIQ